MLGDPASSDTPVRVDSLAHLRGVPLHAAGGAAPAGGPDAGDHRAAGLRPGEGRGRGRGRQGEGYPQGLGANGVRDDPGGREVEAWRLGDVAERETEAEIATPVLGVTAFAEGNEIAQHIRLAPTLALLEGNDVMNLQRLFPWAFAASLAAVVIAFACQLRLSPPVRAVVGLIASPPRRVAFWVNPNPLVPACNTAKTQACVRSVAGSLVVLAAMLAHPFNNLRELCVRHTPLRFRDGPRVFGGAGLLNDEALLPADTIAAPRAKNIPAPGTALGTWIDIERLATDQAVMSLPRPRPPLSHNLIISSGYYNGY